MSKINKVVVKGVSYDIEDAYARLKVNNLVKHVAWNDSSRLNDFTTAGVYEITGERKMSKEFDNLPIDNKGSGHTISARLEVLDSSINDTTNSDDKCITQKLTLSNRVGGDGNVYIRTGRGRTYDSITWEKWGTLQTNINVGQVGSLDEFVDNGIYSGVWTDGSSFAQTFVMVVINDYAVAGDNKTIVQYKYAYDTLKGNGEPTYNTRSLHNGEWSDWEDVHDDDLNVLKSELLNAININKENIAKNSIAIGEEEFRAIGAEETLQKNIDNTNKVVGIEEKETLTVLIGVVFKDGSTYLTYNSVYTNAFKGGDIVVTNDGYYIYEVRKVSADGVAEMVAVNSKRLRTEKGYTYQLNISKDNNAQFSENELEGIVGLYNYEGGDTSELEQKIEEHATDIQYLFEEAVKFDTFEVEELGDGIGINFDTFNGHGSSIEIPFATEEKAGVMSANDYNYLHSLNSTKELSIEFADSDEKIYLSQTEYPFIPKGVRIKIESDTITTLRGYTGDSSKEFTIKNGYVTEDAIAILQNFEAIGSVTIKYTGAIKELEEKVLNHPDARYIQDETKQSNLISYTNKYIRQSDNELVYINDGDSLPNVSQYDAFDTLYIKCKPNTQYSVSKTVMVKEYDKDFILLQTNRLAQSWDNATFITSAETAYVRIQTIYYSNRVMALTMVEGAVADTEGKRVITTLKDSVKTDSIIDFSISGKNIDVAGVKTYNMSNSIILFDKTVISEASWSTYMYRLENVNLFIKNFYIKKLPDDATGKVFLRQILVNLPNFGYAFNFSYEKNDGSLSKIPGVLRDEEFSYFENEYFKIEVDFDVYKKQNLSGEVLFCNGKVYPINIFALKDFVSVSIFNNNKVQTENNTTTISSVKNTVGKALWNTFVLVPTTNSNMMAKFKSLFKVSSPANVLKGEMGTLVDLSTHEFVTGEWFVTKFIKVKPNTTYSVSNTTYIQEFDDNFIFISSSAISSSWSNCTFTTKSNTSFIRVVTVYTGSNLATTQQAKFMNEGDTVIKHENPQDEVEGNIIGQLMDGSVGEEKLSPELQQKINLKSSSDLSSYTMYSIGDSMSAANKWQSKVVELTGIQWSAERNIMGGSPLSVGGTNTYNGFDSGLMRTWNLVKNGYIQGDGENTVVIFQNVNDGKQAFAPTSKIFTPTQIIEGYNEGDWSETLLGNITPKYGTIIKLLRTGVIGKNLSVTKLPTKAGNITLKVGWSGPGIKNYNIAVTASETVQSILNKILEWQYDGITDSLSANGTSVDFSRGATDSNYPITVQFIDTDNTGMEVNIVDTDNASTSVPKYFFGDSLDTWTDVNSWKSSLTWSEAFMASIEMIQRNYPKAKICISIFPRHHAIPSDYKRLDGTFDTNKWLTTDQWEIDNNERVAELEKLCKYYNIDSINVDKHCNISLSNYSTYYPDGNIHPNNTGYMRIGEVVASKFKEIL